MQTLLRSPVKFDVLLVEDDPGHAELISRAFESDSRCELNITATLEHARSLILSTLPDLIITDIRLPDGRGTELLANEVNCPTIVMTSYSDDKVAVSAIKSGAADYIVKTRESMESLPRIASRVMREWRLLIDQKLAVERQNRLTAILEATPDLICIANLDGFLTYINLAGRRLLGIDKSEDISSIRLADFHSGDDARKILSEGIPCAIREGLWTEETTFLTRDGEEVLTSQVLISHRNDRGEIEFFSTIARDIRHLREAEQQVEYLAYYDALTGLPNRNELLKRLEMEMSRVNRNHNQGALMFIDLDNFKNINDSLGHPMGDLVLQEIAQRLQTHLRADDTVARIGGDEFIVILSSLSNDDLEAVNQVRDTANKIRSAISRECKIGDSALHITASIGISMISAGEVDGNDLLRFADTAMYQAKREGRNQLEFFSEGMSTAVSRQLQLEIQLRQALKQDQFRLYYQPLVDESMKVIGAEALIRWQHPEQGLLAPGEFLDVLESSGQILEVGNWVFKTALQQMAQWANQGCWGDDMKICINISPRQFRDRQFVDFVQGQFDSFKADAHNIIIEVTEHNIIHNMDDAIAKMELLKQRGIRFSLDDFGTGYSSLSHLKNLPVSHIKIDRSFVKDICVDASDEAMVGSILALCRHLGLEVVAEGVETTEQFELLRSHQCKYYQGYFFSKPLSPEQMQLFLQEKPARG